ncbi:MAG: hypothetical protein ACT4OX_09310 [Actinomycetota bacterium]
MDGRPPLPLADPPIDVAPPGAPIGGADAPDDGFDPEFRSRPPLIDRLLDRVFFRSNGLRGADFERTRKLGERLVGATIVLVATWIALEIINPGMNVWPLTDLDAGRLFTNTTTNGGDMGAHVWWPNFLAENWFPKLRLSGWAPDWYAGFPAGHYYFPLPAVLVTILDAIPGVPYNVAFKLVTVSGVVALPASAYAFARGLRAPWPAPPAFAIAALGTLVQTRSNWQIYGGNIASTLAGEFSFTIALALGLFGLGAVGVTLDTGKRRWVAPLLIALAAMSHVVVAFFVALVAVLMVVTRRPRRTWPLAGAMGAAALAVTAVWTLPLVWRHDMTQSMRYAKELPEGTWQATGILGWLPGPFERTLEGFVRAIGRGPDASGVMNEQQLWLPSWMWVLMGIAVAMAGWHRRRSTLVLLVTALVAGIAFVQWLPYFAIWNTRFLPFWLLCGGFLAAIGATELALLAGKAGRAALRWVRAGDLFDARARAWNELAGGVPDAPIASNGGGPSTILDAEACALLRVREDATEDEVDRAFRQIVADSDGEDIDRFRRLSDAYARLREQARARDARIDALTPTIQQEIDGASDCVDPALRRHALDVVYRGAWDRDPPGWTRPSALGDETIEHRSHLAGFLACTLVVVIAGGFGLHRAWDARDDNGAIAIEGWARWNYDGYERKTAWPEYSGIMVALGEMGEQLGCGRLLWEPSSMEGDPINTYGTSLALELIPHFTDGCIGSMEGLYFESSATTSFHFLTVAELAAHPSNPVRSLPYGTLENDFDRGVQHLQMLGVRYYMAWTAEAQNKAAQHDDLELVSEIPDRDGADPRGWKVYEVADSALVEGLRTEPVVAEAHGGKSWECFDQPEPVQGRLPEPDLLAWECSAADWWGDAALLDTPWVESGPDEWQRVDYANLDAVDADRLPRVAVTDIEEEPDTISFKVDRTGVPVVVKTSYFPNWEVRGADGPWRLAPNLMVVIPTDNEVTLTYGLTGVDWLGRLLTVSGIVGLVLLARWKGAARYAAEYDASSETASADAPDDQDAPMRGDAPPGDDGPESPSRARGSPALP